MPFGRDWPKKRPEAKFVVCIILINCLSQPSRFSGTGDALLSVLSRSLDKDSTASKENKCVQNYQPL